MRNQFILLSGIATTLASAQTVTSVYNRDTHDPFKLKRVSVESTVVGPIVRTDTWLTYENPYKTLTEATLNFDMPEAAALGGFAYQFGDEYVPGQLMDKNKAWFIYTAITSRNRDPGIMEQWTPTTYHCQIFPIKMGSDLRVRLWTVGMLEPSGDKMNLPKPKVPMEVSHYRTVDSSVAKPDWIVRTVNSKPAVSDGDQYSVDLSNPVTAVAQRFKDGRIYVAGLIRTTPAADTSRHSIRIEKAFYGPVGSPETGADVTDKLNDVVSHGAHKISANNTIFGDPNPSILKRLIVSYTLDGRQLMRGVPENESLDLYHGEGISSESAKEPTFFRLRQPKTVQLDDKTLAFSGWLPKNRQIAARFDGIRYSFKPDVISKGSDTARLWAQQMLAHNTWMHVKDVLAFSLKYGVPSNATALLAVPKEEMKLFKEKEKQFQKIQAEQRRRELEAERQQRNWAKNRQQNWRSSGGGDPEIRVTIPGAKTVEAILPDRRVIALKPDGDVWGGNFEIPADAIEGTYKVRVLAHLKDGTTTERSWTYEVDRTPPKGHAALLLESGKLILEVKSESGLAEVAAYATDGTRWVLREVTTGVYRVEVPRGVKGQITVVLKDHAGNKGELHCSPLP